MLTLVAALLSAPIVLGHHEAPEFVGVQAEELQWMDAAGLPAGAKAAVVYGDPSKAEPFVVRIRFPADFKVMPHSHLPDEFVTILSGRLHMGHGDRFDASTMSEYGAGDFFFLRAGARHFVHTMEAVEIEVHATGPWGTNYVNPEDDPRA
jgi:quercetin dioxygenase-like cupin family protein